MQRLVIAMMTMASLIIPGALRAQQDGQPVDPARGPHAIDEPVSSSRSGPPALPPASDEKEDSDELTVGAKVTEDSLIVSGRKLILAGHIKHDVLATDSTVIIEKTATVGGAVFVTDCVVDNRAGDSIKVIKRDRTPVQAHVNVPGVSRSNGGGAVRIPLKRHEWFKAQLALLIFGLLGAALSVFAVPNASRRVADHVASNPKRDLRIGAMVGAGMMMVLVADAILLKLPLIRLLWAPIGIMVAFAPLLVLGFGWLAGMRCAGDYVARKMNLAREGSLFARMALGLLAFFMMNVVLAHFNRGLGVIGLCIEIGVALMGLGATAVIAAGSGFGRRV